MAIAALAAGCGGAPAPEVERERFVDVMVALRTIARESETPEAFDARRDSVLRAAGVTDSALVAFARVHGRDVDFMAAVWDTIARRLLDADTAMR